MAVIYGDHTKHVDTLCGQSVDLVLLREGKGGVGGALRQMLGLE